MKDKNEKCIADMYLASALFAYGARLLKVDRDDRRRQKFCFDVTTVEHIFTIQSGNTVRLVPKPSIEVIENEFIAKTLLFPPNYPDAIRSIKSAIHVSD